MQHRALRTVDDAIAKGEEYFLSLSHGIIATLIIAAVIFRYFIGSPLVWTEELIIILFSWMLFIGFSNGFAKRMQIRIDAFLMILPKGGRTLLGVIAVAATLTTLLGLAWFGAQQALIMLTTETPMMRISATWAVASLPVSAVLASLHVIRHLVCEGPSQTLWPEDMTIVEGEH